jgi:malate dehydrogenase (oxaloacetate-decarboxylating)
MKPEFKLISSDGSPTIETRLTGKALLSVPQLNKGTAFTLEERKLFKLSGKLPSRVETIEDQIKRAYAQFTRYETSIEKNIYLMRSLITVKNFDVRGGCILLTKIVLKFAKF